MAIEIDWSVEADETFSENIVYLQNEWSEKEVEQFVKQTDTVLKRLQIFPESYPYGNKSTKYRKAKLNKYIALFYRYYKTKRKITLISFWNVKQNPDNLKF
jgi:hypothetical protein